MTDRKKAIEVLRLSEPVQKTHSLMETAICIAKRESYLTDEEEATLRKAVELANEALEQTRWIPYDDDDDATWPEDGTWNIFTNGKQLSVERFKVDALNHFYPNGRWFELDDAIAWMSLPQPYKGESEE